MKFNFLREPFILLIGVIAALGAFPLIAWAQQEAMITGQDPNGVTRMVLVDTSGRIYTNSNTSTSSSLTVVGTHGACTNTTLNIGTTGADCPTTQRTSRSNILIQLVQSGETLTITTDGSTTATATAGIQITSGASYSDNLAGSVAPSCRCTAATCSVRIVECP